MAYLFSRMRDSLDTHPLRVWRIVILSKIGYVVALVCERESLAPGYAPDE